MSYQWSHQRGVYRYGLPHRAPGQCRCQRRYFRDGHRQRPGPASGVQKLIFYLGGNYLLTDYSSPYIFVLPTTKFVDGARSLEVEAVLRDGSRTARRHQPDI